MNASPLICMMKAGITEILPALFKDIVVPEAVNREILAKRRGIIPSTRGYLESLKEVGLWLSDELIDQVCRKSGE